ncbi:MAG: polysaccharide biosynthesis protein, partial [Krumholzibacteria bacterium]|nr:polysaccharide biosynthesis protein [Candidatus Krumholzibacteria bacterium]
MARLVRRHRRLACAAVCAAVSLAAFWGAFLLRFEMSPLDGPSGGWDHWFWRSALLVVAVRTAAFLALGLHRTTWRYAAARDVVPLGFGTVLGSLILVPALLLLWQGAFPRSVLAMDAVLCFLLLAGARFGYRLLRELLVGVPTAGAVPVIVVGAGSAGNLVVRAMHTGAAGGLRPVAILDDDPLKQGTSLQGVPVAGGIPDVEAVARRTGARAIVLALPTASTSQIYRAVQLCRTTGLPLKTTPDLARFLEGSHGAPPIHDFRLEDLLHRRPLRPDNPAIGGFLAGRTVLITGAAGSIGSELCRQIAAQGAGRLVCLDKDENGLFRLEQQLARAGVGTPAAFVLGDIRDRTHLHQVFARWRPAIVFHAAAYKHVPLLQHHPVEAVLNNVLGTRTVADLAAEHGVGDFVLISTDKAVNPSSVMGATKRIAERIVRTRNLGSATRFSVIRFGNVLGSNGSVVELFQEQIRRGGPVTVTHPDIERYFMTIPEAVHLVLFAATMGGMGETFILDMGRPVRIAELAAQMIRLSGLVPGVDVAIEYTGLRPGEKLTEELWTDRERPAPTAHPGILRAPGQEGLDPHELRQLEKLVAAAQARDLDGCWRYLLRLVPTFQGRTAGAAAVPPDRPVPAKVL